MREEGVQPAEEEMRSLRLRSLQADLQIQLENQKLQAPETQINPISGAMSLKCPLTGAK
jgi:hypothetical protein